MQELTSQANLARSKTAIASQNLEATIESLFFQSRTNQGYSYLVHEFENVSKERKQELQQIQRLLNPLQNNTSIQTTEIINSIISPNNNSSIKVRALRVFSLPQRLDGTSNQKQMTLFALVYKNIISIYVELPQSNSLELLQQHKINFSVSDDEEQYKSYPKQKSRVVQFVRSYRNSIFTSVNEDLFTCTFFDLIRTTKTKNQNHPSIQFGIVAGGSTGFVHFIPFDVPANQNKQNNNNSSTQGTELSFQVHGDIIFDMQVIKKYPNILATASKDGSLMLSNVSTMSRLVLFKDFEASSPVSQFTCIDIHINSTFLLSACGDGTLQVWKLSQEVINKIEESQFVDTLNINKKKNDEIYISVTKAECNYQIPAQEDIQHTVQAVQVLFYGDFLIFLTAQGYINIASISASKNNKEARLFDTDSTGKTLHLYTIASFDLGQKLTSFDKVLYLDQLHGLLWAGCSDHSVVGFDLKERQTRGIDHNYSPPLVKIELPLTSSIRNIHFLEDYSTLFVLTSDNIISKYSFA